jgi:hypothetical protein
MVQFQCEEYFEAAFVVLTKFKKMHCFPANPESSFNKGFEETNTKIAEDTSCHDPNTEEYSLDKCDNVLCDIDPGGDAVHTTSTPEGAFGI